MNYMPEVAKMLGVELGEEFKISNVNYVLADDGLINLNNNTNAVTTLTNILTGTYTIERKPWKPNKYEAYFLIDEDGLVSYDEWMSTSTDLNYYKLGNCYRSQEEAEKNKQKWIDFYSSDEVLEV